MKSALLHLSLLSLLAGGAGAAGNDGEDPQEPSVLVRYDLRPVLPRVDKGTGWSALLTQLNPAWWADVGAVEVQALHEDAAPDQILDLVTQALGDALNVKGSQISLESDSQLLVLAPAAVQGMVAEVLGVLESVLSSSVSMRVDVIGVPGGIDPELLGRNVMPTAEAGRLVETLAARGGTHRQHGFQLAAGRTSAVDQSSTVPVVYDYDVEIAQGSLIWDPIIIDVMDGLRLFVRGVPRPDGTVVSALILQSDLLGGVQDRPLELKGSVSSEKTGGLTFVSGPQAIQTVDVLTCSLAFTSFIPDGQAIVAAAETRLGGETISHFIVMRQQGNATPGFASAPIRGTNRTLALVNTELFRSPTFAVTSQPSAGDQTGHPIVSARLSSEYSSFVYDWLRYRYSIWKPIGPWAVVVTDPSWDARGAEALEELVRRADTGQELISIQVDMVSSEEEAEPPVRWSVPVLAGTQCGSVLGISSTAIRDYDVEVAQYSGVPDPLVQPTFNGLALGFEVSRGRGTGEGGSSWVLDARGTGQFFRGPVPTFEQGGPVNGRIDRPEYDVLNLDERVRLPRQDGGVSRVRLGPQARHAERGGLSLMVTIRG